MPKSQAPQQSAPPPQQPQQGPWSGHPQQQPYGHAYHGKPYKKRKSFLEELFD